MKTTQALVVLAAMAMASAAQAASHGVVKFNVPACYAQNDAKIVSNALSHKDFAAILTLLEDGRCLNLNSGQSVYLMASSIGYVRVRIPGTIKEVWVFSEAVTFH